MKERASKVVLVVKNLPANVGDIRNSGSISWEDALEGAWQPTLVFLPGESQGQRSLGGCRPQGHRAGQD